MRKACLTEIPTELASPSVKAANPRRCRYIRTDATQCKANAQTTSEFCYFHDPSLERERAEARRTGGIARTRKPALLPFAPIRKLDTVSDVIKLLGETINQVRRGELDLRISNSVGYLSAILLGAIEKGSLEQRLAALEASTAQRPPTQPAVFDDESGFEFVSDGER